jgi:Sec-independent protein secretion pathway component TatC
MIHRIVYITALQIVVYTLGIPMLVAYEVGIQRLQTINNRTASASSQVQASQSFPASDAKR